MPINGNDLDEEDQIQDEDLQPPPPQQVYLPPTPPPVAPPPLSAPVSPGDLARSQRPPVMPTPGFNLEQWREQNAEMPIAQAEQAVASAMRFQGIRQYQQDLASGMTAAEALAKSAPLLFGGPKQGNLGQAAAFIRATRPPATKYQDIGGVLYEIEPGKRPVPLSQKATPFANLGPTIQRINKLEEELKDTRTPSDIKAGVPDPGFGVLADEKRAQLNAMREQLRRAQSARVIPAGTPTTTPITPAAPRTQTPPPVSVAPSAPPTVTSREQFDRLPSGTIYIGKGGRRYRKP